MNNLLNLAKMSEEEFLHYKKIINHYDHRSKKLTLTFDPYMVYAQMINYFIDIWFDTDTLLIHHPDKPAIVKDFDNKYYYYLNQGKLHRTDGLVSNYINGCYAIDNKIYHSLQEYDEAVKKYNEKMYLEKHPELEAFI